jgi:hypothetical protein
MTEDNFLTGIYGLDVWGIRPAAIGAFAGRFIKTLKTEETNPWKCHSLEEV